MPRIKDTDIVLVRERARIDEVVRDVVALKPAGGGSLKGCAHSMMSEARLST